MLRDGGTPTKEGSYTFSLNVSDSSNPKKTSTKEFTVKIGGKKGVRKLGTTYNKFDDIFFKYGEKNQIPPDLLKSIVFQEALGQMEFGGTNLNMVT